MFILSMILSATCLILFSAFAVKLNFTYKRTQIMTPSRLLAIGVFLSSWILLFPYYFAEVFRDLTPFARLWESIWVAAHHVIRFFVVDVDFSDFQAASAFYGSKFYIYLGTALILLAPILTFSVILSFWKNFDAYRKFLMHPYAPVYVFSELNEKSLSLATDIKSNDKKSILIFTDLFDPDDEESFDLLEAAKELGALCFKKDMLALNLKFHAKTSPLFFFAIAEAKNVSGIYRGKSPNEENLMQARRIMTDKFYSTRPNTHLFVFSSGTLGEMLFDNLPPSGVNVRKVNRYSSFVRRLLYTHGKEMLFDSAIDNGTEEKQINAVVIGGGRYGNEMIKALTWFCQMDGYRVNIDVIDGSRNTGERFAYSYPGLMQGNGNFESFDLPRYQLTFHDGVDVATQSFADILQAIHWPTYILVALGSDEMNVSTAVEIRRLFRRNGCPFEPHIDAIVYNSDNKEILDAATKRGVSYNINCIGNLRETFSRQTIIKADFEQEIYNLNRKFGGRDKLDDDSFNSTEALMIHCTLREKLCPHLPDDASLLAPEDCEKLKRLEHRRWMAYMFSEGYLFGPRQPHGLKDPVAKTHALIMPYSELSSAQKDYLLILGNKNSPQ